MFTTFYDTHSGGYTKLDKGVSVVAIEAPEDIARYVFEQVTGLNSYGVACECCGADFSVHEHEENPYHGPRCKVISAEEIAAELTKLIPHS